MCVQILRMLKAGGGTCVYVAAKESIAHARFSDWSLRFGALGVSVAELSGDSAADLKLLEQSTIVVATAEHWDMLSRRWRQRKAVQVIEADFGSREGEGQWLAHVGPSFLRMTSLYFNFNIWYMFGSGNNMEE